MSTLQSVVTVCPVCGDRLIIPVQVGLPTVGTDDPSTAVVVVRPDMGDLRSHMGAHAAEEES